MKSDRPSDEGKCGEKAPEKNREQPPVAGRSYLVTLCSGEIRRWRHLGCDARGAVWWQDVETLAEFSESSLMYAWTLGAPSDEDDHPA